MKRKILISLIFLSFILTANAQTPEENLKKYWHYRQRLEEKFVWVSACNEKGSNIPALLRNETTYFLRWDDLNQVLPYYIAALATEYRLLKDNGQDYIRTRDQLYYAILAFERLDYYAETFNYVRDPVPDSPEFVNCDNNQTGAPLFNGFFKRDDIDKSITNVPQFSHFKDHLTVGSSNTLGNGNAMSKDNVWNLLIGFALVKKLVDDPTLYPNILAVEAGDNNPANFQRLDDMVKDICHKIAEQFHGTNNDWRIHHPYSGCTIDNPEKSGDILEPLALGLTLPFQRGFNDAFKYITGESQLIYPDPSDIYKITSKNAPKDKIFKFAALATVGADRDYIFYDGVFNNGAATKIAEDHIWLHLLYEILHGNGRFNEGTKNNHYSLLNDAPMSGIIFDNSGGPWSHRNRLTDPHQVPDGVSYPSGDCNGLDYMLLHNLWWLNYNKNYCTGCRIYKNEITYNVNEETIHINNTYNTGSHPNNPKIYTSNAYITADNQLNTTSYVTYQAKLSVKLQTNFYAPRGSIFHAKVTDGELSFGNHNYAILSPISCNCSPNMSGIYQASNLKNAELSSDKGYLAKSPDNSNFDSLSLQREKELSLTMHPNQNICKIFPNPNDGKFVVYMNLSKGEKANIYIYDLMGKLIKHIDTSTKETDIQLENPGIYLIKMLRGIDMKAEKVIVQ